MNILLKVILIIIVFTVMGTIIPDSITLKIDNAIMYFMGQLYQMQPFLHVDVLVNCIQILVGYFYSIGVFIFFVFVIKSTDSR